MSMTDILKSNSVRNARIMSFLCGPPTLGEGSLISYLTAMTKQKLYKDKNKRTNEQKNKENELEQQQFSLRMKESEYQHNKVKIMKI